MARCETAQFALEAWDRWQATGERSSLDAAINALRTARRPPGTTSKRRHALLGLARDALAARLALAPSREDLDEIIDVISQAVEIIDVPSVRSDLGYHLMLRYYQRGSLADLNAAVVEFKKALSATPPGEVTRYGRILNIAWASEARYDRKGARDEKYRVINVDGVEQWRGPRDLVVPISLLEAALEPQPGWEPPPPVVAARLKRNLANLLARYARDVAKRPVQQRTADVTRAITLLDQALADAAPRSEDYVTCAHSMFAALRTARNLGFVPEAVYDEPARQNRLTEALSASIDVEVNPVIAGRTRLNLAAILVSRASRLGSVADERQAAEICRDLLGAPDPADPSISLEAARVWAAWSLSREAWSEAAEAHEKAQRHVAALIEEQRDWRSRYLWTREAGPLAAIGAFALAKVGRCDDAARALDRGRTIMLSERLGLAGVRARPLAGDIRAVYLVSTVAGGLALSAGAEVESRAHWLPDLTAAEVGARVRAHAVAYDEFREDPYAAQPQWFAALNDVVQFLSDSLRPFLEPIPSGARLAVVPIGVLGLLPVFAAIVTVRGADAALAIAPSLGLLKKASAAGESGSVVVVRDRGLTSAAWEAQAATGSFPDSNLLRDDTTAEQVLAAWPAAGVIHFACHAELDFGSPLNDHIALPGGGRLDAQDFLLAAPAPARLVVLSACESGVADPYLPDEGIGLSAALLASAADAVVATLWPVDDLSTALLMLHFYWLWRRRQQHPSTALAHAQVWVRDAGNESQLQFVRSMATEAALIEQATATAMIDALAERFQALGPRAYAHPHYWAGFIYSGPV